MPAVSKPTLLIVDDELEIREVLRDICMDLNVEILLACDGLESTEIIFKKKVDVVLSDINMPHRSGLEVLKMVRSKGMKIPYLVLTGYRDVGAFENAIESGATALIEKPFDVENLLLQISRALSDAVMARVG